VIDALIAAVDGLVDAEPGACADNASIVELHRQLARLEGVASREAARWDAKKEWSTDGARSGGAWLAAKLHVPRQEANRRLRLGRALRHLPHAEQAWLAGDIGGAHVAALAACHTEFLAEQLAVDEHELVEKAKQVSFRRFEHDLAYWRQEHDPESEDRRMKAQVDGRQVHLSPTFQGSWRLDGMFDPIAGTILHDTLMKIERELFEHDWADAKEKLGREPLAAELSRTPAQRRADALVEMAVRARTAPANGRRPEPLFTVLIGLPRFEQLCELANGTVITPGSLTGWFSHAWIERVVFQPPSRVIDVGERRRLFEGATRRAVEVRDLNQCFHDLCEDPIEQIDHIQPHSWDGPTTQDNGRGACAFHNRQRHRRGPPGEAA
jgi:hypothetical protein